MDLTTPSGELLHRWRSQAEDRPDTADRTFRALIDNGVEVGLVLLGQSADGGSQVLVTLWIDPEHHGQGLGRRGIRAVEDHCRRNGARQLLTTTKPMPEQQRLFVDWEVTSRHMELSVGEEAPVLPDGVTANRMTEEVFASWQRHSVGEYATDIARAYRIPVAVAREQARQQFTELLPQGLETSGNELWSLNDGETQVAILWVHTDHEKGLVFIYDVESDAANRGKGYGRAATRLAETRALAAGLKRVRLHVFTDNVAANRLYEALGYRVISQNRSKQL